MPTIKPSIFSRFWIKKQNVFHKFGHYFLLFENKYWEAALLGLKLIIDRTMSVQQEFQIAEQPSIITLIESATGGNSETCSICVGYKHQFDIINDGSGTAQRLFAVQEGTKAHLVSATDLYEDEEPELLLCYNSKFLNDFSKTELYW